MYVRKMYFSLWHYFFRGKAPARLLVYEQLLSVGRLGWLCGFKFGFYLFLNLICFLYECMI